MSQPTYKKGDHIQFDAVRIMHGNPVTGKVVSFNDEWIEIKLTKDIAGLNNFWDAGDKKTFRLAFISNIKIISDGKKN